MTDQNPYLSVVNDMYDNAGTRETNLRASMIQAQEMKPDEAAKALPVAEAAGIPLDMAHRNLPELQKSFNTDHLDYQKMLTDYPKLSNFLTNPDNAAVSHDDITSLQKISGFFSRANDYMEVALPHAVRDVVKGTPSGILTGTGGVMTGIGASANRLSEMLASGVVNDEAKGDKADWNVAGHYLGGVGAGALATAGDVLNYLGGNYKEAGAQIAPADTNIPTQVGETLGQFLPWIAATMATGGEAALPALFGASGAGSKLEQEKANNTYGTDKGDLAAGIYGAVNAVLGSKTFGAITHTLPDKILLPVVQALNKAGVPAGGMSERWIMRALDMAYRAAVPAAAMGGIQLSSNVVDKYLLGQKQDLMEGVGPQAGLAGAASFILGAMFHTITKTPTMFDQARANAQKDYFKQSREVLADNKLMKRSPAKLNELINSQTGASDVHVNPEALQTFYQAITPEERAKLDAQMPDLNKDIKDAAITKADMPINQADYHTYIQPLDKSGSLDAWTKLVPEHMSEGEMKAHDDFMQGLFDHVTDQNRNLTNRDAQDTQNNIYEQLIRYTGVGRTPSAMVDVAKMISENPAKFHEVMMARTGGRSDVADVLNRLIRDVQIRRVLPDTSELRKGDMDLRLDDLRNISQDYDKKAAKNKATEAAGGKVKSRGTRKSKANTPLIDYIASLGGIRRGSQPAKELASADITPASHPELFSKHTPPDARQSSMLGGGTGIQELDTSKYGIAALDRLSARTLESETGHHFQPIDENNYVDPKEVHAALVKEAEAEAGLSDKDQERESLVQYLDYLGMDVNRNSNTEIKRAMAAAEKEQSSALSSLGDHDTTFFQSGNQGFYSGVERAAAGLKQEKGSGDQMLAAIQNTPGVKAEEVEWTGLDTFLKGKKNVTKQEIQDYIKANKVDVHEVTLQQEPDMHAGGYMEEQNGMHVVFDGEGYEIGRWPDLQTAEDELSRVEDFTPPDATKFSQYTLPGGENYREVLLTLPKRARTGLTEAEMNERIRLGLMGSHTAEQGRRYNELSAKEMQDNNFKSGHFDQKNILAHVRLDDRTDADGKKVLFMEEMQSDWHQAGRKKGYGKQYPTPYEMENGSWGLKFSNGEEVGGSYKTEENAQKQTELYSRTGVPDAPLKKTWHEAALRRVLQMAAEQGYDKVAWTTGEQQAERYDLSKQVKKIAVPMVNEGSRSVRIDGLDGKSFNLMVDNKGIVDSSYSGAQFSGKPLDEVVGKDMADKIMRLEEPAEFSGEGLKIGGEGMKGFYDKILPTYAKKFGKKFGAVVKDTKINTDNGDGSFGIEKKMNGGFEAFNDNEIKTFKTREEAQTWLDTKVKNTIHSIDITPEMRDSVKQGVSLFQGGDKAMDPRGSITFTPDGKALIQTFAGENLSTVLHEFGHLYWKAMTDIGNLADAPASVVRDIKTMRDWVGAKDGETLSVEQEEKIADGFLTYLRKGEAPSADMQGAFSRFKGWLVRLYTGVRDTLPKISPEVKDVFDRMFATDEEIEALKNIPEFKPDPAILNMLTKAEQERYQAKMTKQIADAKDRLFREAMRQSEKTQTQLYKDQRAEIEKVATEQITVERAYRTVTEILKAGGLDRKQVIKEFGKEMVPYLSGHGGLVKDKGVDPAMMATMMGYDNSRAMMDELMNLKPKKQAIQELTDNEMLVRHGDMLRDGTIEGEALKAYHNNLRAEIIHMEMETAAKAAGIPAPSKEAIKARAVKMMSEMKVKDIIPYRHYQAEIKTARAAGLAAGKKDYVGTATAKGQQLLNHYLYRMALDVKDEVDQQLKAWRKILGRSDKSIGKALDTDYVYAARYILARHGLGKTSYNFDGWLEQLKRESSPDNPNGDPEAFNAIQEAISIARAIPEGSYKTMALTDFQALGDAVNNLILTGRDRSKMMIEGKKIEVREAVEAVTDALASRKDSGISSGLGGKLTTGDKARLFIMSANANWRRVEHWVQMVDKGNNGPVRKYIWNPVKKAVLAYRDERTPWMTRIMDLLEPERERLHGEKIPAPELMQDKKDAFGSPLPGDGEFYTFSDLSELHGMMLHLGNESNRFKLLKGRGWSEAGMDEFMRRVMAEGIVTKHDLDLRQKLWDMMEELKPRLWQTHKEMYGFRPEEVTASPISTPHGEYRGGYWPAIVDTDVSEDAQIRADANAISNTGQTYAFPTAGRGALKSRVESYAGPLQMSMKLLPNHIDWALKFIHIEPAIKDAAKIIMNRDFRDAMRRKDPQATTDMLVPWLQRTAKQITEIPSTGRFYRTLANVARWARTSAGIQAMGGNFANMGIHLTQLAPFTRELGAARMAEAMAAFIKHPTDTAESQNALSVELRNRQQIGAVNPMVEIGRILQDQSQYDLKRKIDKNAVVRGAKTVQAWAHDNAYILQAIVWHMTDHIGWHAAYNKALEGEVRGIDGGDSDKAVEYADSLVRRIQGSHNPEDISNIEMRSAWAKIFQFMYGWFNNMGNYTATEKDIIKNSNLKPAAKAASAFYLHLMTMVAVGFGAEVISSTVRGANPSQNEKYKREGTVAEHWLSELGISMARWEGAKVPYLNSVVNGMITKYTDKAYSDHLTPSPLFDQVDTIIRTPGELWKAMHGKGSNTTAISDLLSTLGFVTSTPISALKKPVKYLEGVNNGSQKPKNGLEFVRGFLGGPAPKSK